MKRTTALLLAVAGLASTGAHRPAHRCDATDRCVAIPTGTVLLGEDGLAGRPPSPPSASMRMR